MFCISIIPTMLFFFSHHPISAPAIKDLWASSVNRMLKHTNEFAMKIIATRDYLQRMLEGGDVRQDGKKKQETLSNQEVQHTNASIMTTLPYKSDRDRLLDAISSKYTELLCTISKAHGRGNTEVSCGFAKWPSETACRDYLTKRYFNCSSNVFIFRFGTKSNLTIISISAAARQPTSISRPEIRKGVVRKAQTKLTTNPLTENTSMNSTHNLSLNAAKLNKFGEKLTAKYEKYVNLIVYYIRSCYSHH